MPLDVVEVAGADDPRLGDYVDLRHPERRRALEEEGGFFVVEGEQPIRTLLRTRHRVRSLLLTPARLASLRDVVAGVVAPVYVADLEVLRAVAGFDIHRGAIASADRPAPQPPADVAAGASRLAVLEDVNDHENMGALFRNAAAFAVDGVLLSPGCCDPLSRRSIRVSIGHALRVPFARSEHWHDDLAALRTAGFRLVALTPRSEVEALHRDALRGVERVALLLGAEGPGLSDAALRAADVRARIPIAPGVDSLNVATAAAIAFFLARP